MAFTLPDIPEAERVPNRIGLIDGDVIVYEASMGMDDCGKAAALRKAKDKISIIKEAIQTDELRIYLTGKGNFRNDIATVKPYKGNRYNPDGSRKIPRPRWFNACRDYLVNTHKAIVVDGQEADDALGITQCKCSANTKWHSIIVSVDKDLRIIPGLHMSLMTFEIDEVSKFGDIKQNGKGSGLKFFYAQLLMGDSTDNIPGLPKVTQYMKDGYSEILRLGGCGPKAAYSVVHDAESEHELYQRVLGCYAAYYGIDKAEGALLEQARLLWIRHYDGELWTPPKMID
jgi:hypothetical protein